MSKWGDEIYYMAMLVSRVYFKDVKEYVIVLSPKQIKLRRFNTANGANIARHIAVREKANNRWSGNEIPYIFSSKYNQVE